MKLPFQKKSEPESGKLEPKGGTFDSNPEEKQRYADNANIIHLRPEVLSVSYIYLSFKLTLQLSSLCRFLCNICGREFMRKNTLRQHILNHLDPDFKCSKRTKTKTKIQ